MKLTIERKVELTEYVTIDLYDGVDIEEIKDDIFTNSIDLDSLSDKDIEYQLDYDSMEVMDVLLIYDEEGNNYDFE